MVYAEAARRQGDDIRLMASIETIGWYSSEPGSQSYPPLFNLVYRIGRISFGSFRIFVRGRQCGGLRRRFVQIRISRSRQRRLSRLFPEFWSDHRSFWHEGFRAVMITDTAFHRYRHYHAPSDTPESCLSRTGAGYIWFVCRLFRTLTWRSLSRVRTQALEPVAVNRKSATTTIRATAGIWPLPCGGPSA